MSIIFCLTINYAQEADSSNIGFVNYSSQFELVTIPQSTTLSFYRPTTLLSGETYNLKFIHGPNILVYDEGFLSYYLEYDVMSRLNKLVLWSINLGIESGICYRYMIKNGPASEDGLRFTLGILLEYEINDAWQIILRNSLIFHDAQVSKKSKQGIGIRFKF